MKPELASTQNAAAVPDLFKDSIRPRLESMDRNSEKAIQFSPGGDPIIAIETSQMKGDWVYRRNGRTFNLNANGLLSSREPNGEIRDIDEGLERDIVMRSLELDLDKVKPAKKESPFRHIAQIALRFTHS